VTGSDRADYCHPDSDLAATVRKLEARLRNRPDIVPVVAGAGPAPQNVALTCPCNGPSAPGQGWILTR
jgi:hypothetical protein